MPRVEVDHDTYGICNIDYKLEGGDVDPYIFIDENLNVNFSTEETPSDVSHILNKTPIPYNVLLFNLKPLTEEFVQKIELEGGIVVDESNYLLLKSHIENEIQIIKA